MSLEIGFLVFSPIKYLGTGQVFSEYILSTSEVSHILIRSQTVCPVRSGAYLHSYPRGVERVHPRCLPLECMTGMPPPLSPGLSPLLTRPVCTGTNLARTLHTYNVVVSIPGADQMGSQRGWSRCRPDR